MFKYILFLILLRIKIIYTLKQCDDCVEYTSCPNAMELVRRRVQGKMFVAAFCGFDITSQSRIPMVCCSDFAAAAGNTGIQSASVRNGFPESDQVERTTPTAASAECADCVTYTSCPRALEWFQQRKDEKIFKRAICGYDTTRPWRESKVCCSQFDPVPIESHPNARLLPDADCGDFDGIRIIGGTIAGLYEFPWMALIATEKGGVLEFTCGGSIINSRYILTAAHCIQNHTVAGVRVGDYDIMNPTHCQGSVPEYICETHYQDIQVEQEIVHEGFSSRPQIVHDIALLRLMNPVDFSHRNVAPICLPATEGMRNMSLNDKTVTVAGWGVKETGRESVLLRKVEIPIVRRDTCVRKYESEISSSGIPKKIHENQICAGKDMRNSCYGDSGGPMMLESEYRGSYRSVQYGLLSHGSEMCGSSFPGVYTNVAKYMDWILDHMRE